MFHLQGKSQVNIHSLVQYILLSIVTQDLYGR